MEHKPKTIAFYNDTTKNMEMFVEEFSQTPDKMPLGAALFETAKNNRESVLLQVQLPVVSY